MDKARRIVQKDIAGIRNLSDVDVAIAKNSYAMRAKVILDAGHAAGLLLLKEHGALINEMLQKKKTPPPWLAHTFGMFAREALGGVPEYKPEVQTDESVLKLFQVIDLKFFGRVKWVKDAIAIVRGGGNLDEATVEKAKAVMSDIQSGAFDKTEAAYPFLKFAATSLDGVMIPQRETLNRIWQSVKSGCVMSEQELADLRGVFSFGRTYFQQAKVANEAVGMTNAELVARVKGATTPEGLEKFEPEVKERGLVIPLDALL